MQTITTNRPIRTLVRAVVSLTLAMGMFVVNIPRAEAINESSVAIEVTCKNYLYQGPIINVTERIGGQRGEQYQIYIRVLRFDGQKYVLDQNYGWFKWRNVNDDRQTQLINKKVGTIYKVRVWLYAYIPSQGRWAVKEYRPAVHISLNKFGHELARNSACIIT